MESQLRIERRLKPRYRAVLGGERAQEDWLADFEALVDLNRKQAVAIASHWAEQAGFSAGDLESLSNAALVEATGAIRLRALHAPVFLRRTMLRATDSALGDMQAVYKLQRGDLVSDKFLKSLGSALQLLEAMGNELEASLPPTEPRRS